VVGGAAYRNRTDDLRITRGPLSCTGGMTCTDSTPDGTHSADYTGIPVRPVPRLVPRPSRRPSLPTGNIGASFASAVRNPRRDLACRRPRADERTVVRRGRGGARGAALIKALRLIRQRGRSSPRLPWRGVPIQAVCCGQNFGGSVAGLRTP